MKHIILLSLGISLLLVETVTPCTYCDPVFKRRQTFREDGHQAKFVVYGVMANPRIHKDQTGETDFQVSEIVKTDPYLKGKKTLSIGRYIPVEEKNPPKFLLFCDIYNGKCDPYRGIPVKNSEVVSYIQDTLKLDNKDPVKILQFYYRHLDSENPEIANDAFLEFAKASDQDIGAIAKHLKPEKLRKLLIDPKTPPERLSVFAFLLGACGNKTDGTLLIQLIEKNDERARSSLAGLLGGVIELSPDHGWKLTQSILQDTKRPFGDRLSALNTMRFYQSWKPKESKPHIFEGFQAVIRDGNLADMAIEDLRRWQWWDLTKLVLEQFDKPTHAAPIVRQSIVRYGLSCPESSAKAFIQAVEKKDPMLVKTVEEGLEFDTPSSGKKQ